MGWVLRLGETGVDGQSRSFDVIEFSRAEGLGDIANLGLTLAEGKRLLAGVQQVVVAAQADDQATLRPDCRVLSQSRFSVAIDESYPIDFMILNRCNVRCRWNFATEPSIESIQNRGARVLMSLG
jgi:hypothetical protein